MVVLISRCKVPYQMDGPRGDQLWHLLHKIRCVVIWCPPHRNRDLRTHTISWYVLNFKTSCWIFNFWKKKKLHPSEIYDPFHAAQVCPIQRWSRAWSAPTECPGQTTALKGCITWCSGAGRKTLKTDPPLTTWEAFWKTSSQQQRSSIRNSPAVEKRH